MSNQLIPVSDVERMAQAVAKSGLFGVKAPEQAMALMLIAQAEGLHPAIAARDYHIIQGRPALKADAMLARFQSAGGKVEWREYTDTKCVGVFSHPSGGSISVEWSIDMANKAGLTKNPTWRQYPRQMLRARCISEGIRTVFPGVVSGFYTPEEVQDFSPVEKDITPVGAPSSASTAYADKPTPMPQKVKEAAKPKKPESPPIEGTAKTISGDPAEGDLSEITQPVPDRPTQQQIGNVIHAFASKLNMNIDQINAEFEKWMAGEQPARKIEDWTNADLDEARQMFKYIMSHRELGVDPPNAPQGGML